MSRSWLLAAVGCIAMLMIGLPVQPVEASENGGMGCAACTLVVGLLEQSAQIHNRTLTQEAEVMCQWLPGFLATVCADLMGIVGPLVFPIVEDTGSPDIACNFITLCKNETAVCRLFPVPPSIKTEGEYLALMSSTRSKFAEPPKIDIVSYVCDKAPQLCKYFHMFLGIPQPRRLSAKGNVGISPPSLPTFDLDKDKFSDSPTLRGYDWRGKDCDDLDASVFPGRQSNDAFGDSNCNGVVGIDTTTGATYEDEWCNNTGAMGIALLGDSATAHFRIPAEYLTAGEWNSTTFNFLLPLLENEGDWPMLSWGTGFENTSAVPIGNIRGPMNSLYTYLKELNQCNKNDYQNIGVNGADSSNLKDWATFLNRNGSDTTKPVKPIMVFFSMIGNDVCGAEQNFVHMTTPEDYLQNVIAGILEVDSFVPPNSMIILVPLVDGRILYDTMHNRIHPIGKTNNDVTYEDLYNYLNCLDASPCWGWMNSNETVRNTTWKIASSLNDQLPIAINMTASQVKNVKVYYPGAVMDKAISTAPVPLWELIEPVDGFHPSQTGNALIAKAYWQKLQSMGILPVENPHNDAIIAKFGF